MSALRRIRDWLLRIPLFVVIASGFAICVLFPICAQPLGEAGPALELPFGAMWLVTCALVLAHLHRAVAQSHSALVQFSLPVATAFVYAGLSIVGGGMIGFWLAMHGLSR